MLGLARSVAGPLASPSPTGEGGLGLAGGPPLIAVPHGSRDKVLGALAP